MDTSGDSWSSRLRAQRPSPSQYVVRPTQKRRLNADSNDPKRVRLTYLRARRDQPSPSNPAKRKSSENVVRPPTQKRSLNNYADSNDPKRAKLTHLRARRDQPSPSHPAKRKSSENVVRPPTQKRSLNNHADSNDPKRVRLTQKALQALDTTTTTLGIPTLISMPPTIASSLAGKRSLSTSDTSSKPRSYPPQSPSFQACLSELNVNFSGGHEPNQQDLDQLLKVMKKKRDSPEPDEQKFHEIVRAVKSENETAVLIRMTSLILPTRNLPSDNRDTSDLFYRQDTLFKRFGSPLLGLPIPRPDFAVGFMRDAFSPAQRSHITSPYQDGAGFCPWLICEVKTAMQGPQIADRQNANNAVSVLTADYAVQQRLGLKMEKKIRLITTAHNTHSQWYTAWFFVLDTNGKPEWCSKVIKHYSFLIPEEHGFKDARAAWLNLCEHLQRVVLRMLRDELAAVPESLPTPDDSGTDTTTKRRRIASTTTDYQPVPISGSPVRRSTRLRLQRPQNAVTTGA